MMSTTRFLEIVGGMGQAAELNGWYRQAAEKFAGEPPTIHTEDWRHAGRICVCMWAGEAASAANARSCWYRCPCTVLVTTQDGSKRTPTTPLKTFHPPVHNLQVGRGSSGFAKATATRRPRSRCSATAHGGRPGPESRPAPSASSQTAPRSPCLQLDHPPLPRCPAAPLPDVFPQRRATVRSCVGPPLRRTAPLTLCKPPSPPPLPPIIVAGSG